MASKPRFACDEQLGRLARWLRLQGYDTCFECPFPDTKLLRLAQDEGRIVLTRDRHLSAKTLWDAVVTIDATSYGEQLQEVLKKIRLGATAPFTRCLGCNQLIKRIPREEAKTRVAEGIYGLYRDFYECPTCRKVYWHGTHVKNSMARLQRMKS